MHIVLLVLLILFVIAFLAGRFAPNNPYPWAADAVGALLLICVTLVVLGYTDVRA
jgi:VIT1/CCC1 family predicted Fe2+/Mn2+ transporter